jgi:hypothetical protein
MRRREQDMRELKLNFLINLQAGVENKTGNAESPSVHWGEKRFVVRAQ